MSATFTWKIERLEVKTLENGLENVVFIAHWRVVGEQLEEDKIYSSGSYSSCSLPSPDSDNFILYDEITEEEVLNWIWSNGVDKEIVENSIQSIINDQITPKIVSLPLPWGN